MEFLPKWSPFTSVVWGKNRVLWSASGGTAGNGASTRDAYSRQLWVWCTQSAAIAPLGPFLVLCGNSGQFSELWHPQGLPLVHSSGCLGVEGRSPRVLQISGGYLQNMPRWVGPGKTNTFTTMFTAKMICSALNYSPNVLNSGIMLLTKPGTWKASFMWLLLWWPKCQGFTRAAYPLIKQNQWIYADSFRCCGNLSNLSPAYVSCWILP